MPIAEHLSLVVLRECAPLKIKEAVLEVLAINHLLSVPHQSEIRRPADFAPVMIVVSAYPGTLGIQKK